jgi:hypothetical protein
VTETATIARPTTLHGRGFLPLLLRALSNIVVAHMRAHDESVTVESIRSELQLAWTNWTEADRRPVAAGWISSEAANEINNVMNRLSELRMAHNIGRDTLQDRLRDLAQNVFALTGTLDREFLGIDDSDGGIAP